MVKSDGDFVTICDLPEGEHQYKFVIDGKWEHDPNQATVDDHFNGKNNIVIVKKSDFEVMDALANDQLKNNSNQFKNNFSYLMKINKFEIWNRFG
jgi:5'-AMP-activated protein kinase, regulatory beta subunit